MKKLTIILKKLMIILTMASGLYSCQNVYTSLTNEEHDKIVGKINELTLATYEAGNQKNAEKVYSYFDDNTTGVLTGAVIDSWPAHKDQGTAFYKSLKNVKYSIINLKIDVLSNDVAVVYGQYKFEGTDTAGNQMNNTNGWTWVWNRKMNNWKIVHVHTSHVTQQQI